MANSGCTKKNVRAGSSMQWHACKIFSQPLVIHRSRTFCSRANVVAFYVLLYSICVYYKKSQLDFCSMDLPSCVLQPFCTLRMHHLLHNQVSFWDMTVFFSILFHAHLAKSLCILVHFCSSAQVISSWTQLDLKLNNSIISSTVPTLLFHSVFFNCTKPLGYEGVALLWLLHCPQQVGLVDCAPCLLLGVYPDNMMAGWAAFLHMWSIKWTVPEKK